MFEYLLISYIEYSKVAMPGNKNSGRKKKVVEEHGETEAAPTPSTKKKVGR